ncbi:MAG: hypothetical protein EG824_06340 [Deltaproteobacteria bacterium]|nr:hypothetical protein [Deltaproteobacteria bacterium]
MLGCVVVNYHEGDLERNKHSVELLGKLFDGGTGQLLHMETVKVRGGGEVGGLVTQGIEKLAARMIEKIRK